MKRVAFRTDASLKIGTGHVMRCLTLANALRQVGAECAFICREHEGNLIEFIAQQGFCVKTLPLSAAIDDTPYADWLGATSQADARQTIEALSEFEPDWLIVDHYALDERWEKAMRAYCGRLMVIDDLAERSHDCDLLLDQNLGRIDTDYDGLLNVDCKRMIGPKFALLRPEFAQLRQESLERRREPCLKELLITMGGVDQNNATGAVLEALKGCRLADDLHITVVMGPHAPWLESVQHLATTMAWPTDVRTNVSDMAQLMTNSDLAIGAAGSTSWERCCLGLPSVTMVLAQNQVGIARAIENEGATLILKSTESSQVATELLKILADIARDSNILEIITQSASKITNGCGSQRVVKKILEISI
ncbi:UDP-2,4-diacetamido-2,4,6-trideoxy-beta-L-altropyranose hydrolase [Rhodobacterales bacterium 52_120_T64]|nr:UDP-2,4-diacetamido-2,4,6-trideoxy-beta-L-altropyranose hydrolase [Rhodobacterales bacterium 52_120_T64]